MGMYKYVCVYMHVCNCMHIMCIRVYVYVCGVYMCTGCIPIRVYNCMGVSSCVWMRVTVILDAFVQSRPVTENSELYSLWTRYTGDSKTDPWDDLEICSSSYSEDQMTIQFKIHVISYECLSTDLFLIQAFYLIFSCEYVSDFCIILLMPNYFYTVMPWYYFIDMSFTLL